MDDQAAVFQKVKPKREVRKPQPSSPFDEEEEAGGVSKKRISANPFVEGDEVILFPWFFCDFLLLRKSFAEVVGCMSCTHMHM